MRVCAFVPTLITFIGSIPGMTGRGGASQARNSYTGNDKTRANRGLVKGKVDLALLTGGENDVGERPASSAQVPIVWQLSTVVDQRRDCSSGALRKAACAGQKCAGS